MQAIVIPLRVSGVSSASRQIAMIGRQLASLRANVGIGGGVGVGNGRPASQARATPPSKPAPTFGQQVKNAIMSSRVGMGGGLMPLVSKLVPLFASLPLPLKLFTAAVFLATKAAAAAAESLNSFRAAQLTGGGTAGQTAQLGGIGGFTGSDMNEMARAFATEISTNGIASGYAARAGIYDPGGDLFGNTNKATNMLKWAEALRQMGDEESKRAARITHTEPLLKVRDLSEKTWQQLKRTAELQGQQNSPEYIRRAAELNGQMERLSLNWNRLKVFIGSKFIPIISTAIEAVNGVAESPQTTAERVKRGSTGGRGMFDPRIINPEKGKGADPAVQATQANTDALKQLATLLRNGLYGGGERASGAVPRNWKGSGTLGWNQYNPQTMNLGAFNL